MNEIVCSFFDIYSVGIQVLKDIAPLLSAIAAGGSCYVAWRVKKNSELQRKGEFRKDLYCVVVELSNIVYFFRNFYDLHSTIYNKDVKNIISRIENIDKKTFMIKSDLLYNDRFNENVLEEMNLFMNDYSAWKGYYVINNTDIFTAITKICSLQLSALKAIKAIKKSSDDKKIVELLEGEFYNIDEFINGVTNEINSIRYAGDNLYILFLLPMYYYTPDEQKNIILNMVKCFLSGRIEYDDGFLREKKQLFMMENIDKQVFDPKKMKNLLNKFNRGVDK